MYYFKATLILLQPPVIYLFNCFQREPERPSIILLCMPGLLSLKLPPQDFGAIRSRSLVRMFVFTELNWLRLWKEI